MTLTAVDPEQLPSLNLFLSSVSPGISDLKPNIVFAHDFSDKTLPSTFAWPLSSASSSHQCRLADNYVNVARPVLNPGPGVYESNTYVSLPSHISRLFDKIIQQKSTASALDGAMQIGANVGSMMPDPFHLVQLNPGCLTGVLELDNNPRYNNPFDDSNRIDRLKNPFLKLTNNFNKLLKTAVRDSSDIQSLLLVFDSFNDLLLNFKNLLVLNRILHHDTNYDATLSSVSTTKLVVSCNVNVVNIFALDLDLNLSILTSTTTEPYTSLLALENEKEYDLSEATPVFRYDLKNNVIITSLKVFNFNRVPMAALGLNTGQVLLLNLKALTFKLLLQSAPVPLSKIKVSSNLTNVPITCLDVVQHPDYHFVLVAGTANGELYFLNPFSSDDSIYVRKIEDRDRFVTYFKEFNLSPFNPLYDPAEVIGHIKLSYKPLTCIATTLSLLSSTTNHLNPMLLGVGSEDGLVRIIPLVLSHNKDYGAHRSLVSDIVSNYFHYGIRDIQFSLDCKFLAVAGNGDVVELFRLGYYNVNGLMQKNGTGGRRSRSTTVNSTTSANPNPSNSLSLFLSPSITSPSASLDVSSQNHNEESNGCPPAIKEVLLVCRLKGHTNLITKVAFIKEDKIINNDMEEKTMKSLYRLSSIGVDGKVLFWEFDYRALPKVKKFNKKKKPIHTLSLTQIANLKRNSKLKSNKENLSKVVATSLRGSMNNMNSILQTETPLPVVSSLTNLEELINDHIKGISGLYSTLQENRLRKYYGLKPDDVPECPSVIHPIKNDKLVPSIEIPMATIDLSYWYKDGKIHDIYLDTGEFWLFGSNGDIIKYEIS